MLLKYYSDVPMLVQAFVNLFIIVSWLFLILKILTIKTSASTNVHLLNLYQYHTEKTIVVTQPYQLSACNDKIYYYKFVQAHFNIFHVFKWTHWMLTIFDKFFLMQQSTTCKLTSVWHITSASFESWKYGNIIWKIYFP